MVVAHAYQMERDVLVQAERGGSAAILITIHVPKSPRTEWLRRSWDLRANGALDANEAARGAREVADAALSDVFVSANGEPAQCEVSVSSQGLTGALDDRAFEVVALLSCDPADEWSVFTGARVPSSLKPAVFYDACIGVTDERFMAWLFCENPH
jgi:hypothetical protein